MEDRKEKKILCLNMMQWNAQSLRPKLAEFELLLLQEKIHIALISETWLEPDSVLNISGYNTFRNDRIDSYGGVAIITHKSLKVQVCPLNINNTGIQIICVKLLNCTKIKNIISLYCPSAVHTTKSDWDDLFECFDSKCLIAGDFNAHHTNWSCKTDSRGALIFDAALEAGYVALNNGNTTRLKIVNNHVQSTSPDITFVSTDIALDFIWRVTNENLGSDHLCIKVFTNVKDSYAIYSKRKIKCANWEGYNNLLKESFSQYGEEHKDINKYNMQGHYDNFIRLINVAADEYIPVVKYCECPKNNFQPKPYWNKDLSKLVALRRLALSQFRKNPTPNNLSILEEHILRAKRAIRIAKRDNWQSYCSSIDESTSISDMWNRMRWMKGFRSPRSFASHDQKAELLCNLAPDYVSCNMPNFYSVNMPLESQFALHEMNNCIKRKDTAPGGDGIYYSMIFHLPMNAKLFLLKLYNVIFSTGIIPKQWRKILIMPIPKPSTSSDNLKKFRPISLISSLCKILHSMITKRLEWFIERNNILSVYTSGFRRGQSCQDCLTRLISHVHLGFSKKYSTLACFLDVENAYNNVVIDVLISVLDEIGVGKKICTYLWSFLNERHLKINDERNDESAIVRFTNIGLAQGDPMSPILFNIITHKLTTEISEVYLCQYADDFVVYHTGKNIYESSAKIQNALNTFSSLLNNLGLQLSEIKSKVCVFSRGYKRNQVELKINNHNLNLVDSYKYLGLWLDRSLRWNRHITESAQKAQKFLNLLKILSGPSWGVHPKHLRRIYIALIRSRLDYSCFLFGNSANTHLNKINKIQNQALRVIGGFIRSTPIHVMECELYIPPLHVRRKYLAYKYCLKVLSYTDNVTVNLLAELSALCHSRPYWKNKKIPLLVEIYNEIKNVKINSSTPLEMFKLVTWVSNININDTVVIDLDCVKASKGDSEINNLKYEVLKELNDKYDNNWFRVYTDGSKSGDGSGAAFYVKDDHNVTNNCFKLSEELCIMSLELVAISKALTYLKSVKYTKVVVCTDSKSALYHLARCASGFRGVSTAYDILSNIHYFILNKVHLKLQWVPAHIGLRGNEKADELAKWAAKNGKVIKTLPCYSELLPKYAERCHELWKEHFDLRSLEKGIWYRTIQCHLSRIPWCAYTNLSHKIVMLAHRLRSGHIPGNKFNFLMNKSSSPNCNSCGIIDDVHHRLMECVRYQSARKKMVEDLSLNRLHVGVLHDILSQPNSDAALTLFSCLLT